jgi:hypothetical protein
LIGDAGNVRHRITNEAGAIERGSIGRPLVIQRKARDFTDRLWGTNSGECATRITYSGPTMECAGRMPRPSSQTACLLWRYHRGLPIAILLGAGTSAASAIKHIDEGRLSGEVEIERWLIETDHLAIAGYDSVEVWRLTDARTGKRKWQTLFAALDGDAKAYRPSALLRRLSRWDGCWRRSGRPCRLFILPHQADLECRPGGSRSLRSTSGTTWAADRSGRSSTSRSAISSN